MPRDPADKELDALEMKETKIQDFDDFFERAADPLNEMVEIHNSIAQSEENLKSAAAAIQGEAQVRLCVDNRVGLMVWRFDDKDEEMVYTPAEIEERLNQDATLREAYERLNHAIQNLNEALGKPLVIGASQFESRRGRLFVTKKGDHDSFVRDVNVAVFSLRKQLMLLAHVSGLSEAAKLLISEIAKSQDISALRVEQDENGAVKLMNGDDEVDLKRLKLAKPAGQLRDAMVDLLNNVQTAATSVPELAQEVANFAEEAKTFPGKIPDAVSNSGLGITEIPKATSSTVSNGKALGNGPKIAKATTMMIQYDARELSDAVMKPMGA